MKKSHIIYILIAILVCILLQPRKSGWGKKYGACPEGFTPYLLHSSRCVKCPMGAVPNMVSGCSNIGGSYAFGTEEVARPTK
jgi:hypothetical protein